MNYRNLFKRAYSFVGRLIFPEDLSSSKTMEGGISRSCYERGISPTTIIDVGAAEGKWSLMAKRYWNKSNYILFEPLEERKSVLENICKLYTGFYFVNKGSG
mgnify:FL=1